ncbi:D-alanine--D-alanine ligase family protein [Ornithinimicrobium tianjinense]|uniref:D-alanine--D-alanine ligase n=1 Tax=Ornithinimicrobium tianjinense TaxID=1195761 RepID=A0A917BQD5_9MICO|nr:D-alanine--D-alanine ligase family protein [Ornithinimicrobium tianjinense]GGF50528.1 D-alanine--D-alanine ligase [Ornithinimicrobium tianjinense]
MSTDPASPDRIRVAVVFGGRSEEHAISCATAASVLRTLDRERYDVVPIGITGEGRWVLVDDEPGALEIRDGRLPRVPDTGRQVVVPMGGRDRDLRVVAEDGTTTDLGEVHVVFPLLHGPFGEDGTIQGLLELADIRYVGCGVLASAAMMDKHVMKLIFAAAGLAVGPYAVISDLDWRRDRAAALDAASSLHFPVFVKPARAGSSVGVYKVDHPDELEAAVEKARVHDPKVLVEQGIVGREIECGVLQGRGAELPRVSECGEITVVGGGHEFYDFEAKYLDEDSVRIKVPADVAPEVREEMRRIAQTAFEAAGCEGLARVDCFVTAGGEVIINEINTMPGFTPFSMYPQAWAASGMTYAELVDELIALALERPLGLR